MTLTEGPSQMRLRVTVTFLPPSTVETSLNEKSTVHLPNRMVSNHLGATTTAGVTEPPGVNAVGVQCLQINSQTLSDISCNR